MTGTLIAGTSLANAGSENFTSTARAIMNAVARNGYNVSEQSVIELYAAGIDSMTTVEVLHIENAFQWFADVTLRDGRVVDFFWNIPQGPKSVSLAYLTIFTAGDFPDFDQDAHIQTLIDQAATDELTEEFRLLDEWMNDTDRDFPPAASERLSELGELFW